ncbi:MAG: chorismate synthase, partial [Chlamydiia bacterium]|nr:chorismate synthase [Chlamydiia bacterium]
TTWGESHGSAVGVIIDGCPAGLQITQGEIEAALAKRAPGGNFYVSQRREPDRVEILSGVYQERTTGAPIQLMIANCDVDSSAYSPVNHLLRPGHANATYLEKYGHYDPRGGGRASARETACRVAAGAVAEALLRKQTIVISAFLYQVGSDRLDADRESRPCGCLEEGLAESVIFCPDRDVERVFSKTLENALSEGDSIGGVVSFRAEGVPSGLGSPIYDKLEASLAYAMLSIPASKGFEIGSGFSCASHQGSTHNDLFRARGDRGLITETNHAGGTLGGISTGMPITGRVYFKPTSSIRKPQKTLTVNGDSSELELPSHSRHDPCVAIRAVPVVRAMVALVLADALLMNRSARV